MAVLGQPVPSLSCTFLTHRGLSKSKNEDAVMVAGELFQRSHATPIRRSVHGVRTLVALADGLGRYGNGGFASRFVLEQLWVAQQGGESLTFAAAFDQVNSKLYGKIEEMGRMGATVAGLWLEGGQILAFNAGDARIYVVGDRLSQLSTDDRSPGGKGLLVSQCFGGTDRPEPCVPHVTLLNAAPTTRLLLSTDGLTDLVSDAHIEEALEVHDTGDALEHLLRLVFEQGATDNISLVLVDVCGR